jgi:hypothetical protein
VVLYESIYTHVTLPSAAWLQTYALFITSVCPARDNDIDKEVNGMESIKGHNKYAKLICLLFCTSVKYGLTFMEGQDTD